jgi:hypothetical protein
MFTPEDRNRLRNVLIGAAHADGRVTSAALTGSSALATEDRWSDIDLALGVAADANKSQVIADWTKRMYKDYGAIHHIDVNWSNVLGDWTSLNGNLTVAEFHSTAWDRNTNTLIGGTQDNSTLEQVTPGGMTWRRVGKGDGGQVVVNAHLSGQSVRYSSSQFLGEFRRRVIDPATNSVLSETLPALNILNPPPGISTIKQDPNRQFYTVVAGNRFDERIYIATQRIYESNDGGENFTSLTSVSAPVTTLAEGACWVACRIRMSFTPASRYRLAASRDGFIAARQRAGLSPSSRRTAEETCATS